MNDEKNINLIKTEIEKLIQEYNIPPFEINNGLCDQFAEDLIERLNISKEHLFSIEFFNITDTADYDWNDFYPQSIEAFNLNDTQGIDRDIFLKILKEQADESHVWIVYKNKEGEHLHFDSETIEGVDNPFKLKTYLKYITAYKNGVDKNSIENYLKKYKEEQISSFKNKYKYKLK